MQCVLTRAPICPSCPTGGGTRTDPALAGTPLFRDLAAGTLAVLSQRARVRHLAKGEYLRPQGAALEELLVVVRGTMLLTVPLASGAPKVVGIMAKGEVFGALDLFGPVPGMLAAVAEREACILCIPKAAVLAALGSDHRFAVGLVEVLSEHIHCLARDIRTACTRGAVERIAAWLLDRAELRAGREVVALPASKTVVARLLGMTAESFSRALRRLKDAGVIEVVRHTITITDPGRLAALAGQDGYPPWLN